jgi:hypothetical protein
MCIGSDFARMEAALVLAAIGRRFRFRLLPDQPVTPHPSFTLRPEPGIRVRLVAVESAAIDPLPSRVSRETGAVMNEVALRMLIGDASKYLGSCSASPSHPADGAADIDLHRHHAADHEPDPRYPRRQHLVLDPHVQYVDDLGRSPLRPAASPRRRWRGVGRSPGLIRPAPATATFGR